MEHPPPESIPPELRAFLYTCIDSIEQAEILLFLHRSDRSWTAGAITTELSLPATMARGHLETLVARGLLQIAVDKEVAYRYLPRSAELRRYADQLAEHYRQSPSTILRCIAAAPRRSVKRFADAFKLRDPE